jgi:trehalose 6-phosphate synthase/phosphatase
MGRLMVVSNRLPVSVKKNDSEIVFLPSSGGLATGIASLPMDRIWLGWPGVPQDQLSETEREEIIGHLNKEKCRPVFLTEKDVDEFYYGFANRTIWPLFHYFQIYTTYRMEFWQAYRRVNQLYADVVVNVAKPDDTVWIHDYQLMLLPQLLRDVLPDLRIGFFMHIPFPSVELFRMLPWRREILEGILGADLIGFHTYDYVRHFIRSTAKILGSEHSFQDVTVGHRFVRVDAFPMGIDYSRYSQAVKTPVIQKEICRLNEQFREQKIILAVDRLDYTKGILQRLEAYDQFLEKYPHYREKVIMILVTVPSRTGVGHYRALKEKVDGLVGRINGTHGTLGWAPLNYLYSAVPFDQLVALYHRADVALITPLRDGMNLIAKEYIAAKNERAGVLILSEMAGAASELGEAVIINPNDITAVTEAIRTALEMPIEEQITRNAAMQQRLQRYNVFLWAKEFLTALEDIRKVQQQQAMRLLSGSQRNKLFAEYRQADKRLFLLDYDGTLTGFYDHPNQASPDANLLSDLKKLAADCRNEIVIISGRDRYTLERWLGELDITLIAEHGAWIRRRGESWNLIEPLSDEWKANIKPILRLYCDRTPGAILEEKNFSLVWHCRRADPDLAAIRMHELKDAVLHMTENLQLGVFQGHQILEVRNLQINKGRIAKMWLEKNLWPFILAIGDDYTDEDAFAVLPPEAWSIRVGTSLSQARFNIISVRGVRDLISRLANESI